MHRSYLFAPGHNEKLLGRVFDAGADAVMLDLADAVPPHAKAQARARVSDALADRPTGVRINAVGSELAAADLEAVAGLAAGICIPKVESAGDVRWAGRPGTGHTADLRHRERPRDPRRAGDRFRARPAPSLPGRRRPAPSTSTRPSTASTLGSTTRTAYAPKPSSRARWASSANRPSPRQLPILHDVFTPSAEELCSTPSTPSAERPSSSRTASSLTSPSKTAPSAR